jgi:hypothetical protein
MAIVLDEQVKFFPTSASLSGSESGGRRFPPGSSPLADSAPRQTESKYPMHLLIQLKRPILIFPIALACIIGLVSKAQAVSPSLDGGYPGNNTAEDQDAFFSLTTGTNNTALDFDALYFDTAGSFTTATGFVSLFRTPPAATTRPTVFQRSLATPPAATHSLNSADPLRKRLWVISKLATATLMVVQ